MWNSKKKKNRQEFLGDLSMGTLTSVLDCDCSKNDQYRTTRNNQSKQPPQNCSNVQ